MGKITIQLLHFPSDFFIKISFGNGIFQNFLGRHALRSPLFRRSIRSSGAYIFKISLYPLTDDLRDLLHYCLMSSYFQCNGKHYKQVHEAAMGSPVSIVVAEIVMQKVEEHALATYEQTLPFWLRYVDDTITAVPNGLKLRTPQDETKTSKSPQRSNKMAKY